MKYRTFVRLRAAVVALVALGAAAGIFFGCRSERAAVPGQPAVTVNDAAIPQALVPATREAPAVADTPAANPAGEPGRNYTLTDIEREVLHLQKEQLTNGASDGTSRKWVVKTSRFKAEFRCDEAKGFNYWNRVKLDFNNNKRYEEKWDFKPDTVKRRVAPSDDENYSDEYRLQGETWV